MPLSSDPAKRANQLRNIQRAWPKVKANHGLDPADPASTEPESGPVQAAVPVLAYDTPTDAPAQTPPAAEPEPEPRAAAVDEPADESRGGFWSGFLGG